MLALKEWKNQIKLLQKQTEKLFSSSNKTQSKTKQNKNENTKH